MKALRLIEEAGSQGLSWGKIWEQVNKEEKTLIRSQDRRVIVRPQKNIGSKTTLSKKLKVWEKNGYIERDVETRKYRLLKDGKKYLQKSDIVDSILSSKYIDTYFRNWSPSSKEPASTLYNLVQTTQSPEQGSSHSIPLLISRARRTQPLEWLRDVIDYAKDIGLLDDKKQSDILTNKVALEKLWKELFGGVERLTVVETLKPSLLLNSLEHELFKPNK